MLIHLWHTHHVKILYYSMLININFNKLTKTIVLTQDIMPCETNEDHNLYEA